MSWPNSYWDAIEEIYWEPRLLGLKSIPKQSRADHDDFVCFPKSLLSSGGSIFTRPDKASDNLARLRRLEVPLNHIFDICFSIAPSSVIESIFLTPLSATDGGSFERIGREIASRYPFFGDNTATQQDGFFVSNHTLIGVEVKIDAPTSQDQLLKYVALMMAEEIYSGKRANLVLTFITLHKDSSKCFSQCGLEVDGSISDNYLGSINHSKIKGVVKKLLDLDADHFAECLSRLHVSHLSWESLARTCESVAETARQKGGSAETLERLMAGMAQAIRSNPCASAE